MILTKTTKAKEMDEILSAVFLQYFKAIDWEFIFLSPSISRASAAISSPRSMKKAMVLKAHITMFQGFPTTITPKIKVITTEVLTIKFPSNLFFLISNRIKTR